VRNRSAEPPDAVRLVLGLQPVREAVKRHGAALLEVLIEDKPSPKLEALSRFATDQSVARIRRVSRSELDRLSHGVHHQGVAARAPALELLPLDALIADEQLVAIALDSIQDPHNFGAVIRCAVALGNAAVIFGEHAAAPLTPATFRASAGAIEHARLCRVRSLGDALATLHAAAVRVVGLDAQAPGPLSAADLRGPSVLVLGSEGEGLGRGIKRHCTELATLGAPRTIDSLNASVAAGIALYEVVNQRLKSTS
jgi:23S rRNA (guanosine2251-2'-O)-methyltransferase